MENAEINNIIKILGLQYKLNYSDYEDVKKLRYLSLRVSLRANVSPVPVSLCGCHCKAGGCFSLCGCHCVAGGCSTLCGCHCVASSCVSLCVCHRIAGALFY
mgnify:CR=1 FL=1